MRYRGSRPGDVAEGKGLEGAVLPSWRCVCVCVCHVDVCALPLRGVLLLICGVRAYAGGFRVLAGKVRTGRLGCWTFDHARPWGNGVGVGEGEDEGGGGGLTTIRCAFSDAKKNFFFYFGC